MSNVWATMPYVQLSHKRFVNCIDNSQSQLFSEMSLRDVMELPIIYIYCWKGNILENLNSLNKNVSVRVRLPSGVNVMSEPFNIERGVNVRV